MSYYLKLSLRKRFLLYFVLALNGMLVMGQDDGVAHYRSVVRPTKNLIVMLTDGTSVDILSAARWYQIYNQLGGSNLYIDPWLCGLVKTYSSNAPIVDSAPAMSAYMTGMPQQSGNISVYPPADGVNDLLEVDSTMAYQPLATVLEAAKILKSRSVGLVVTVEFPHATPAACSTHGPRRSNYAELGSQMIYQNLDVMFGGGNSLITDDMKTHLQSTNTTYLCNDLQGFRRHKEGKVWALWEDMDLPYVLDTDTTRIPSLHERTDKAIELLSQNPNGFFLMVEGSKVDWAAHAHDPAACITEYLDFDRAIHSAITFAKQDGNTTVVILSDHGNSGFSIGRYDLNDCTRASIDTLFHSLSAVRASVRHLGDLLKKAQSQDYKGIVKRYTNIDITDDEVAMLVSVQKQIPQDYMKASDEQTLVGALSNILNRHNYIGFTSGMHTGEDVILACYHPKGDVPMGLNTNIEINRYLTDVSGFDKSLPALSRELFSKHTDVFADCKWSIDKTDPHFPVLTVKKGKNTLSVQANKSVGTFNGKPFHVGSVVVYVESTNMFYLPRNYLLIFNRLGNKDIGIL